MNMHHTQLRKGDRQAAAARSPALPLLFLCASHHIPIKINYMPKSESLGKGATNGKMESISQVLSWAVELQRLQSERNFPLCGFVLLTDCYKLTYFHSVSWCKNMAKAKEEKSSSFESNVCKHWRAIWHRGAKIERI